jgi:hypothetical protein
MANWKLEAYLTWRDGAVDPVLDIAVLAVP